MRTQPRALAVAVGATIGMLAVPGAAFAYWTAHGSGGASVATGSVSLSAQATSILEINGALSVGVPAPGTTGGAVVKVTNPNGFAVTVVGVSAGQAVAADGCSSTGSSWLDGADLAGPTIPANSTQTFSVSDVAAMDATSANPCQGTTFTIPVTVTVRR
jgi:hypothetical protein